VYGGRRSVSTPPELGTARGFGRFSTLADMGNYDSVHYRPCLATGESCRL